MREYRRRGHAAIEAAVLVPAFIFCSIGVFDAGFYCWALIATQNAARAVAVYAMTVYGANATPSATIACGYALQTLRGAPNVGSSLSACTAAPVQVTFSQVNDAFAKPAATATVVYQTIPLLPLPGIVAGQLTITRTVQMRI